MCVPIAAVPDMLAHIEQIASRHDVRESPMLPTSVTAICIRCSSPTQSNTAAQDRAKIAFEEILSDALALGGTVTGEHGVGLLKRNGVSRDLPLPCSRGIALSKPPSIRTRFSIPARSSAWLADPGATPVSNRSFTLM